MSPSIRRTLGGFCHRVDHRLTVQKPQKGIYVRMVYPPLMETMEEVGL